MLIAALRTSTYLAGCPTICLRMCFNIPRALSLIFRTSYATRAVVRPPEPLLQRSGVTPALLLLGRLGGFSRPSRGFQFRNPLHELGEQRVGTSAGFALLLHLALEVADT